MKSIYFLVGVTLFLVCALLFVQEHSKTYEMFTEASAQTPGATTSNPTYVGPTEAEMSELRTQLAAFGMAVLNVPGNMANIDSRFISHDDALYFHEIKDDAAFTSTWASKPATEVTETGQGIRVKSIRFGTAARFLTQLPTIGKASVPLKDTVLTALGATTGTSAPTASTPTSQRAAFFTGKADSAPMNRADVEQLIEKVSAIITELGAIQPVSASVTSRMRNLQALRERLRQIVRLLGNGSMRAETVPVNYGDARTLLLTAKDVNAPLLNVINESIVSSAENETDRPSSEALSQLRQNLQVFQDLVNSKGGVTATRSKLLQEDRADFEKWLETVNELQQLLGNPATAANFTATQVNKINKFTVIVNQYINELGTTPPSKTLDQYLSEKDPALAAELQADSVQAQAQAPNQADIKTGFDGRSDAEPLNLSGLTELTDKISQSIFALKALRSRDPIVISRIQNLERLNLDVKEIQEKLKRGEIKPADVPITVGEARKFLDVSRNYDKQLPQLIQVPKPTPQVQNAQLANVPGLPSNSAALMDMAKYLKWSINLSFDSDLYARDSLIKRVDTIIDMLRTKQISGAEAQRIIEALSNIQSSVVPKKNAPNRVFDSEPEPLESADNGSYRTVKPGYMPDEEQVRSASTGGFNEVEAGSGPTNASIRNRASSAYAAYAYDDIAQPDWKERTMQLCSQIERSGLGISAEFGCIRDPNTVSQSYGWKGAYKMVCQRLEDTWGGSYPQMFGCPPRAMTDRFASR